MSLKLPTRCRERGPRFVAHEKFGPERLFKPLDPRVIATSARPPTNAATSSHWSFQSVKRPAVPRVDRARSKTRNEVDAFVAASLAEKSTSLRAEADRRTLIRRVSIDLIGLPPSPEEVAAFIADRDPKAYERLIDRLLASPHYGERWGRHWLDVAGFAESSLFIGDVPRQVLALSGLRFAPSNRNHSNQFVIEQLAGDELFTWRAAGEFTTDQIELLTATDSSDVRPTRPTIRPLPRWTSAIAQQSGRGLDEGVAGLTVNCVRCHNHKFDPIEQEEYYRLVAIFQPAYDPEQWPGIECEANVGSLRFLCSPAETRRKVTAESPVGSRARETDRDSGTGR